MAIPIPPLNLATNATSSASGYTGPVNFGPTYFAPKSALEGVPPVLLLGIGAGILFYLMRRK